MKDPPYNNFCRITYDTRIKLKTLSIVLDKPIIELVRLMTERLWEEKEDLVSHFYSQTKVNREIGKILSKMKPK